MEMSQSPWQRKGGNTMVGNDSGFGESNERRHATEVKDWQEGDRILFFQGLVNHLE